MFNPLPLSLPAQTDAELRQIICREGTHQTVPARFTILEAGEPIKGVYYILGGRTRHFLLNAEGSEKILYVLTEGYFFGDSEYLLNSSNNAYVMSEEPTEFCLIPTKKFARLMETSELVSRAFMTNLAIKYRLLCNEVESLVFMSSKERLLQLIYSNTDPTFAFDGKWFQVKRNYTLQEIGTILGISRVTVSKLINEFCNEGVIRIVNRRMQVNIRQYNLTGAGHEDDAGI